MRILVTGCAGFIGSQVCLALLRGGHEVVGADSLTDYYPVRLKQLRLDELAKCPQFAFQRIDIASDPGFVGLIANGGFFAVINLAAQAGVRHSLEHPEDYVNSNIVGFMNVLEGCRRSPAKPRLVYASSSSVYGGQTELPFNESQRVDRPLNVYAASKCSNELFAHAYTHLFGLRAVGLRFFSVYGPWGRPDMAMWIFAEAMLEGRPVVLNNGGAVHRSFTYIDDIVQGVIAATFVDGLAPYSLFNLGNDKMDSVTTVVDILESALGIKALRVSAPMPAADIEATWADVQLARAELRFSPETTPLTAGLHAFALWLKDNSPIVNIVSAWRSEGSRCR